MLNFLDISTYIPRFLCTMYTSILKIYENQNGQNENIFL